MIRKNGNGAWRPDWITILTVIIQVIVIVASITAIHYKAVGEIKGVLQVHESRLGQLERTQEKQGDKLDDISTDVHRHIGKNEGKP